MSQKIFHNHLVAIRKSKYTLKLKKLEYIGIYILNLSKVLTYEFHYDYIKNHGTVIRTGITCKKIPCYVRDSANRWLIVEIAEIFRSYVKKF